MSKDKPQHSSEIGRYPSIQDILRAEFAAAFQVQVGRIPHLEALVTEQAQTIKDLGHRIDILEVSNKNLVATALADDKKLQLERQGPQHAPRPRLAAPHLHVVGPAHGEDAPPLAEAEPLETDN